MPPILLVLPFSAHFWQGLHIALTIGACLFWAGGILLLAGNQHRYRRLSAAIPSTEVSKVLPTLSILVPACNEEATVERAMRSLLALDYPALEIIAVDD